MSVDTNDLALTAELTATAEKKLAWLQSIDQAVMLAITDHEIGDRVKILVQSWANYAPNYDRGHIVENLQHELMRMIEERDMALAELDIIKELE